MDESAVSEAIRGLLWQRRGNELVRVVQKKDFDDALFYVNEVARVAQEIGHHPDIDIRWNSVTLHLSTHSLGGISDADIGLARAIDAIT